MLYNVASQKWRVYAFDTSANGVPKTGDAANITGRITKDDGTPAATNDVAPTEVDATNQPGWYEFDLTQAETAAYKLSLACKSSTSGVSVIAANPTIFTRPQYLHLTGINSSGHVTRVVLNDTTTTNTDMRGTDGANTVAPLDAAGTRTALGMAAANLDSQFNGIPAAVEASILDEGDATALLAAIAAKVEEFLVNDGDATATLAAIGTAVWSAGSRTLTADTNINYPSAAAIRTEIDANSTKTGYKLASDGLDAISTTAPLGVASDFREMLVQVWRRFFAKSTLTSSTLTTYADDGTTPLTEQTVSDDGTTQTQGVAS